MIDINYFKDLLESIHDYRKIILLCFIIKQDINILKEFGMSEDFVNKLYKEFKNTAEKELDNYNSHLKNLEEAIIEKILDI